MRELALSEVRIVAGGSDWSEGVHDMGGKPGDDSYRFERGSFGDVRSGPGNGHGMGGESGGLVNPGASTSEIGEPKLTGNVVTVPLQPGCKAICSPIKISASIDAKFIGGSLNFDWSSCKVYPEGCGSLPK